MPKDTKDTQPRHSTQAVTEGFMNKETTVDLQIELALADYDVRSLRRQVRWQRQLISVLSAAVAAALVWAVF